MRYNGLTENELLILLLLAALAVIGYAGWKWVMG